MRPTKLGVLFLGLTLLTLTTALASGNNLLYLLYSAMFSALLLSAAALWLNTRDLHIRAAFPERVFAGVPFSLRLSARNTGRRRAYLLALRGGGARAALPALEPGEERELLLTVTLARRGVHRLEGAAVESRFPFGLLARGLRVGEGGRVVVLPKPSERESSVEAGVDAEETGSARPRKGFGDELLGARAYEPGDEPRLINWKLTARTGRLLVNELAEPGGSKVTVRLEASAEGEDAERRIRFAAAACKRHIEAGAEVRLLTGDAEIAYGKGPRHLDAIYKALALTGTGKDERAAPLPVRAPAAGAAPERMVRLLHLGTLGVYASLFLVEEVEPRLLALLLPLFALGWRADRKGTRLLPDALWGVLSAAMLAFALFADWKWSGLTLANTHLLTYLLVHQALNPKRSAGLGQTLLILFLAFFLVSGQTISLWYFPFFVCFAAFCGAWLMQAQLEDAPVPAPALAAGLLPCLALAGLAFAATPRLEPLRQMSPFVAALGLDKRQVTQNLSIGFTENISLGYFGQLKKSSARVMRIRPLGEAPESPAPALYVRGSAFDQFDGRRWGKSPQDFRYRVRRSVYSTSRGRAWAPRQGARLLLPGGGEPRPPEMEYTVFPLNVAVLFTHGSPRAVEEPENAVYFDHTDTLYFGAPYISGISYRVDDSGGQEGYAAYIPRYEDLLRERFLQLPELDPRISELALRVTRSAATPFEKARAVESHLRRTYPYSTFSDDPRQDLSGFLLSRRGGNCEFFASAAVVLLRQAGVPARLVTGFLAGDWNEYGRFYDVRQSQAHAWAEAYIEGSGWIRVDGTPSDASLATRAFAARERLRRYFVALQAGWYRNVIGYDRFVQRNTFQRLRFSFQGQALVASLRTAFRWLALAFGLASLALAFRRLKSLRSSAPPTHFDKALRLLERRGLSRPPHETPREFARRAAARRENLGRLSELAELHYIERFSGRPLAEGEKERGDLLLKEVASSLSA